MAGSFLDALVTGQLPDERLRLLPALEEYRLLRRIGQGAMGCVYLAHDALLDRPVAIKFLAGLVHSAAARQRFLIEARAIARLTHPHVVSIYRSGEWLGHPFLVSEYVRGQSLEHLERPLPAARVRELGLGLSRGLAAAHRRGVLHRDLKPANILALPTPAGHHIKVLDFGLAMAKSMDVAALSLVGTLTYMAPELLWGGPPTESADLYAFGVTAFELLAGRSPFVGGETGDVVSAILSRTPDTGSLPIPEPLRELLGRLLAKDPAARPRDASQLCAELAAAVGRNLPAETSTIRDSFLQAAAFVARNDEVAALMNRFRAAALGPSA